MELTEFLDHQRLENLYRKRLVVESAQGPEVQIDGRRYLSFCSNDYLGLANHPRVVAAFKTAADKYGVGSGASHLITGHQSAHHALEEELAEFTGRPRALLFSTGYMANLGTVAALLGRKDAVFEDRLNHASLLDAGMASGAKFSRYRHGDVTELEHQLADSTGCNKLVMTDGVFSMDGDLAPLPRIVKACEKHGAWLMVDDAHGLGVMGHTGRGSLEYFNLGADQVPILMGTLGKAFGTFGAFVAGSHDLVETLIQKARTYIYTTALPASVAEATRESLRIIQETDVQQTLRLRIYEFRDHAQQLNLPLDDSISPVQPLVLGDAGVALRASELLLERGFLVPAIRPPTVPKGSARLRITLSAAHSREHTEQLLDSLAEVCSLLPIEGDEP